MPQSRLLILGPAKNFTIASWLRSHSSYFQTKLGTCYRRGIGTPVDIEKSLFWLNKATEAQLAIANNNLGDLYTGDLELPYDHDKALQYYQAAADLGEPRNNWLGYLYDLKGDY